MSFISDVKSFASNAVQRVEQKVTEKVADVKEAVTEKVSDVKQKAAETLTQAQEEVSGLRSSFDTAKAKVEKAVSGGALTAAINVGDLKKANPGTLAGVDEEGIAKELSGQALKDPKGVTEAIGGLDSSDRDDVSEELTKNLSDSQLKELAGTPDGRQLLNKLRFELDEGPTWPGEQAQVDRIDVALKAVPASKPAAAAAPAEAPKVDPKKLSATGAEYDPTKPKVSDSEKLPESGEDILKSFSQLNGLGENGQGVEVANERCGSTALVAGAVANGGRQGAVDLAKQLAKNAKANKDPDRAKIYEQIAKNLSDPKTATYGELARLNKTIFNQFASGAQDALSNQDLTAANKAAGTTPPGFISAQHSGGKIAETFNNVDLLEKGQSWPAKIAVNGSSDGNHWIQLGKDKDGRVYVYDPMPKPGEPQIIYRDKDDASKQKFTAYQNAMLPSPGNTTKGWADPG